jgi:type IV secretory pathway VirB4 component
LSVFDLREYRTEPKRYGSLLNWDALDDELPWLLHQRDRSLLATMQLSGPDLESAEDHALVSQATQLNHIMRRFGSGWCLMSEDRQLEIRHYPKATWPDKVSAGVDTERETFFTAPGEHYITESWFTMSRLQPVQRLEKLQRYLYENMPEEVDHETWARDAFIDEVRRTQQMVQGACREKVKLLEGNALATYLHSCCTFHRHGVRMPDPACYLNTYLSQDVDYNMGLYPSLGAVEAPDLWIACVSPQGQQGQPASPNVTYPGILTILRTLPFEWKCVQRYLPLNRDEAVKIIRRYAQQHKGQRQKGFSHRLNRYKKNAPASEVFDKSAEDRAQEASDAQAMVEAGHWSQGYLSLTVVLWDKDRTMLARKVQQTEAALHDEQYMAKAETYNTGDAWMGTMPGDHKSNVRQPLMTSLNFCHGFPATASTRGIAWNARLDGPPLLMAQGRKLTPVGISTHHGDVGHSATIGMTGDGKSTWNNLCDLSWLKYPRSEVSIFDKGGAAQVLTYLVGGAWYDLGVTPLQPLADLHTPHEILWAVDWASGLLEQEHVVVTPRIKKAFHGALLTLATWGPDKRTMTNFASLVTHDEAQEALALYTQAGPYGQVLDADHTEIGSNRWVCFETNSILERPSLLASVLPVVFHLREKRLRGAPARYTLHEGWVALDTAYWANRLRGWLKGLRVKNGSVHLSNQSLAEAVTSHIMPALLDNIATWIFTPNDKALEEEVGKYYRACGLNLRQRELIKDAIPKQDYYIKAKTFQAMVNLCLGPIALGVCRTYEPEELDRWAALYAQDPEGFVATYCQQVGITL